MLTFTRIQGKTPELFGYQILRISSASMEPKLQVGDIILSKSVRDITAVKLGDVITYHGEVGSYTGKTITHEIVREPYESNGTYYMQTMGIANSYPDPEISEEQVIGRMVCALPILSSVYNFFMTPMGLVVVLGFLALMFINEVLSLRRLFKESQDDEADYPGDAGDTSPDLSIADYQE